jgi:hypothetical protein
LLGRYRCRPKLLRYRLLHVAARLVRGQRRTKIRIDAGWPYAAPLAESFHRLARIWTPLVTRPAASLTAQQ